jgi:hypothetical protein
MPSRRPRASRSCRQLLHELAPDDFAAIQRDNEFLFSLGFLADTAHKLQDVRAATVLYDLLAPFAHLNAANADELATGSVSRPLGVLAATLARWDDAVRHFDAASAQNSAMGARPWVAHTRPAYGTCCWPGVAPSTVSVVARYWPLLAMSTRSSAWRPGRGSSRKSWPRARADGEHPCRTTATTMKRHSVVVLKRRHPGTEARICSAAAPSTIRPHSSLARALAR